MAKAFRVRARHIEEVSNDNGKGEDAGATSAPISAIRPVARSASDRPSSGPMPGVGIRGVEKRDTLRGIPVASVSESLAPVSMTCPPPSGARLETIPGFSAAWLDNRADSLELGPQVEPLVPQVESCTKVTLKPPPMLAPDPRRDEEEMPSSRGRGGMQAPRRSVPVDHVGVVAMDLARSARKWLAPRVIASQEFIRDAPVGPADLFLVSLIDGKRTDKELADLLGGTKPEVAEMLQRLVRLGIVAFEYA